MEGKKKIYIGILFMILALSAESSVGIFVKKNLKNEYIYIGALVLVLIILLLRDRYLIEKKNIKLEEVDKKLEDLEDEKDKLQKKINEQKEISEKAITVKNMLLRNMSHEIRTPMNSILSICEIMQVSNLSLEQKNYVEDIKFSANSLMLIMNEIIEYSKLDTMESKMEINKFNLGELMNKLMNNIFQSAYRKGLEAVYYIEKDVPLNIKIDKNKLSQVLATLTSNAVKYTSEGYIYIHVSKKDSKDDKIYLEFMIKDTGMGIDSEKAKEIFSFYKNTMKVKMANRGTGIGLPVAKNFINTMGGEISFFSEKNKGTEFVFTVPVEEIKNDYFFKKSNQKLEVETAVVISDQEINKKVIAKMLNEKGVKVSQYKSVEEIDNLNEDILIYDIKQSKKLDNEYDTIMNLDIKKIYVVNPIDILENKRQLKLKEKYVIKPIKKYDLYKKIDQCVTQNKTLMQNLEKKMDKKILVVEDNEINRATVKALLEKKGYTVEEAENGKIAIEKYQEDENIELIIMDIQMPVMDGYEASKQITESAKSDKRIVNIIALTAYVTSKDKERCFESGMSEYISKPFNTIDLYEKVKKYI